MPDTASALVLEDGFTRDLCARLASVSYDDLPHDVVQAVKLFVLDTLGCIGGAAGQPGLDAVLARLGQWETGGDATMLLGRHRVSPPTAAFANAASAHALDFDDQHDPARVHAYCVSLPAALAAAEAAGDVDGRQLILALALGVELHSRLGLACYDSIGRGWTPTVLFGGLAAAVAAGKVLGLDGAGLLNAMGIAYSQGAGNMLSRDDGAYTKRLAPGYAARTGVLSAFLAADGVTGPWRVLEGTFGLFRLYERGEVNPGIVTEGLGETWHLRDISMKPYPCCRCCHTVIQLALDLRGEGVSPGDIEAVEIYMGAVNHEAVCGPYRPELKSPLHAQFSAAYGFARALVDGRVDLSSYTEGAIVAPAVAALAARTDVRIDPDIPRTATEPAWIRARLAGGAVRDLRRDAMKGSPADPMAPDDVREKLRGCLRFGLGASNADADRLAEAVAALDSAADIRGLITAFPEAI
ncbi:MAG: MmgE/PrpD family protein [Acetobacterales bacterium]